MLTVLDSHAVWVEHSLNGDFTNSSSQYMFHVLLLAFAIKWHFIVKPEKKSEIIVSILRALNLNRMELNPRYFHIL